jgi:nitroreductase
MPDMGLFEAIYSARFIRRLKFDPVPEELKTAVVDAAIRAPSGGNAQSWAFIVLRDPEQRYCPPPFSSEPRGSAGVLRLSGTE